MNRTEVERRRSDLARARAATMHLRPANVTRAEPLTAVRVVPRAPVVTRRARVREWRRTHYVADQALRVLAILSGLLLALFVAGLLLVTALHRLVDGEVGLAMAVIACAAVVAAVAVTLARRAAARKSGYGFHWSKCK